MNPDKLPSRAELAALLSDLPHPDQDADEMVFASAFGWPLPLHGAARSELARLQSEGSASFTGSVDAALLALRRLIPEAEWKLGNDGGPNAEIHDPATGRSYTSVGATPALALLSAAFHVLSRPDPLALGALESME